MKSPVFFTRHVPLSMAARAQQSSIQPAYSLDSDTEIISNALATLLRSGGGRWSLTPTGNGLQRTFKFKSFKKTWVWHLVMALICVQGFMNAVAQECTAQKHHPEWSNVYNNTFIRWTTHSPPGLSIKDVMMAAYCDTQGETFGECPIEQGPGNGTPQEAGDKTLREIADIAAAEGGLCCVPKK